MTKEERLEQLLTQLGYDEYDRCSMYTVKDLMLRFTDSESQRVIDKACDWLRNHLGAGNDIIMAFTKAMTDKTE